MGYVLYGSKTSPFVRRIRVLFDNIPYEFKELNIFEGQDAVDLNKINPINQVPVLVDGENTIWDSRQIFNYLNSLHRFQNMDWQDENMLTAIDGAMDSGVSLLLMKRSGINTDEPFMYVQRQKDRVESIMDHLKPYIAGAGLSDWNFLSISIYCFLDWARFRSIIKFDNRPECIAFLEKYKNNTSIINTEIPKA
ncbi:MAG: glutathione S-transferase family protein [Bdellovibrionales bacterium]|nr:glutathione S-transferase family protein [Bdellovibrionales bacterium]